MERPYLLTLTVAAGGDTSEADPAEADPAEGDPAGFAPAQLDPAELDDLVAGLVADLNTIDAVNAALASAEPSEPGSKALGALLLGALTAEVNGANARKLVGYLRQRLLESPRPVRVKLSRKDAAGAEVAVELEGTAADQEALEALLSRVEACVTRLS